MRKAGWHIYRDGDTGRLVTNCYRREEAGLSAQIKVNLEIVANIGTMVRASPVEPVVNQAN